MNPAEEKWVQDQKAMGSSPELIADLLPIMRKKGIFKPSSELCERISNIEAGRMESVTWPWPLLTKTAPVLVPGGVLVVAGSPGASKSFMMLQCMNHWVNDGIECSILSMEDERSSSLHRLLAQLDGNADITDWDWIKANPSEAAEAFGRHENQLDKVGHTIHTTSMAESTYDSVLVWVAERCRDGHRVIVVDPVTAATPTSRPWEADLHMIQNCKDLAKKYGNSIVLVSHPTKQDVSPAMENIAGGAAVSRFVSGIFWLQWIEREDLTIKGTYGIKEAKSCNRKLYLLKVRDGIGSGLVLGHNFSGNSLTLEEMGIIIKDN